MRGELCVFHVFQGLYICKALSVFQRQRHRALPLFRMFTPGERTLFWSHSSMRRCALCTKLTTGDSSLCRDCIDIVEAYLDEESHSEDEASDFVVGDSDSEDDVSSRAGDSTSAVHGDVDSSDELEDEKDVAL